MNTTMFQQNTMMGFFKHEMSQVVKHRNEASLYGSDRRDMILVQDSAIGNDGVRPVVKKVLSTIKYPRSPVN